MAQASPCLGHSGIFYYNWFLSQCVSRGYLEKASDGQRQHIVVLWSMQTWAFGPECQGWEQTIPIAFLLVFPLLLWRIKHRAPDITGETPSLKYISSLEMYAWNPVSQEWPILHHKAHDKDVGPDAEADVVRRVKCLADSATHWKQQIRDEIHSLQLYNLSIMSYLPL